LKTKQYLKQHPKKLTTKPPVYCLSYCSK